MIKSKQLDAFYLVMTTGSVSAAARALRISQPTASRLIRDLECEIKLELFTRRQGRIYPNADACGLFEAVKKQYGALHAIDEAVDELSGRRTASIGIAALPSIASVVLPRALAVHSSPARFEIRSIENHEVSSFLKENPEFLGISSDTVSEPDFEIEILFETDLVVAVPAGHPLSGKSRIALDDLNGVPLARAEGAVGVFNQVDVALQNGEVYPQVKYSSNRSDFLYSMVEAGLCCAIVEPFGYFRSQKSSVILRQLDVDFPVAYKFISLPYSRSNDEIQSVKVAIKFVINEFSHELKRVLSI